jgi:hypothetical protein
MRPHYLALMKFSYKLVAEREMVSDRARTDAVQTSQ